MWRNQGRLLLVAGFHTSSHRMGAQHHPGYDLSQEVPKWEGGGWVQVRMVEGSWPKLLPGGKLMLNSGWLRFALIVKMSSIDFIYFSNYWGFLIEVFQ